MRRASLCLVVWLALLDGGCAKISALQTCQKAKGAKTPEEVVRRIGQADKIENLADSLKAWRYNGEDGQCIVMFSGTKVQSVDFIAAN